MRRRRIQKGGEVIDNSRGAADPDIGQIEDQRDRCPYPRPFPAGFRDCAAFQPQDFLPIDTLYQPLAAVLTCQHLAVGVAGRGQHYGRCRLGTSAERLAWVESVRAERLAGVRRLLEGLAQAIRSPLTEMQAVKSAARAQPFEAPWRASDDLRQAGAAVVAAADGFLEVHHAELEALALPLHGCKALTRHAVDLYLDSQSLTPEVTFPEELVGLFPPEVRSLISPARP